MSKAAKELVIRGVLLLVFLIVCLSTSFPPSVSFALWIGAAVFIGQTLAKLIEFFA